MQNLRCSWLLLASRSRSHWPAAAARSCLPLRPVVANPMPQPRLKKFRRPASLACQVASSNLQAPRFPWRRRGKGAGWSMMACCSMQQGHPPAWPGRAVAEEGRRSWEGPKPISIVGSTGSIGTQTLDIVAENPDKFRVVALAAGSNVALLADQVKRFKPQLVAIRNASLFTELKDALADAEHHPEIIPGEEGVIEVARHQDAVTVVTGIVGCAGLKPNVAAIESGKDIALANKETLIAGGPFVLPLAHKHKVKILPADSEHSAIFQCIQGLPDGALRRITLTASGGAFRDWHVEKLKEVKGSVWSSCSYL